VASFPGVGYEALPWEGRFDSVLGSRAERARHVGLYRAAVVPEIAHVTLQLADHLSALVSDAATEVARFDQQMGGEIAPFSSVLLRTESAASSRIENLTASARAIAEAELGHSNRANANEIVANSSSMSAALDLAADVNSASILAMHEALMKSVDPGNAGRWRTEQVWIGGSHLGPHHADFVPPHDSRVRPAMADLVGFIRREDLPVLVQAAIAHAQFETIHPFIDGNGRTGRALVHSMLRNKALTSNVTVPISAGLLADTDAYIEALVAYRRGVPSGIIEQFAQACFRAVGNGRELVGELRRIRQGWQDTVRIRRDSAAWRLADLLIRRPVLNARVISQELSVDVGNVHRYTGPLLDSGILTATTEGKRNQVWRSVEVLQALDAFAARAGRRTAPGRFG
jgi:Fic family protein